MYGREKKFIEFKNRNFTILWKMLRFAIKLHTANPYPLKWYFVAVIVANE